MTMGGLGVCQLTSSFQQWALRVLWGLKHPACLMTPPPLSQPHQPLNRSLWSLSIEIQERVGGGVPLLINWEQQMKAGSMAGVRRLQSEKRGDKEKSKVLRKKE